MRNTCGAMCVGVAVRGGRSQMGQPGPTPYAKGHAPAGRESTAPWLRMRFRLPLPSHHTRRMCILPCWRSLAVSGC